MAEVCTVFTPRPDHPQWRPDYIDLLHAQRESALAVRHTHIVITDRPLPGFDCRLTVLPSNLMKAMIAGVIARLARGIDRDICFVDVDCLIVRPLQTVFMREKYDLGLTYRDNEIAPINNGVMYVTRRGGRRALEFFRRALDHCGAHWGADQEAISAAAAPVPSRERNAIRSGALVRFFPCKDFAAVPKVRLEEHGNAYVIHFKGQTKDWMLPYAREILRLPVPEVA